MESWDGERLVEGSPPTWRLATAYIVSMAGAALVAGLLLGANGAFQRSQPATSRAKTGVARPYIADRSAPRPLFVLVDARSEADEAFVVLEMWRQGPLLPTYELVFGETEEERSSQAKLLEMSSAGWGGEAIDVVDLRKAP